jgi:hypothetical protein
MTSLELSIVVRYAKEIVYKWFTLFLFLAYHVLSHIKPLKRELDSCVLLLLHTLEPLEVDHKDSWSSEYLEFLDCLLVEFASAAEPSILV